MKVTTKLPDVKPNVVIELTWEEAETIHAVCGLISGPLEGRRQHTDTLYNLLEDIGVDTYDTVRGTMKVTGDVQFKSGTR